MPLGLSLLSIVAVLGVAGWLGQPLNVASQILPPLLIAVGVSASIHLLSAFYRDFDANGDRRRALGRAIAHAGPATLTTGLTTAAGLASFALASDMAPVHQLGVLAPIGVLITLGLTLIGLPAGLACLAIQRAPNRNEAPLAIRLGAWLGRVGVWTLQRPGRVLFGCGILASAALAGTLRIEANNDALAYFPKDHPIRTSTEIFDRSLAGSINLELIVDTGRAGGLHDPELLATFDALEKDVRSLARGDGPRLRKAFSLADLVRETHAALVGDAADTEPLPRDARLVAQELLLFEAAGADGLDRFAQDLDSKGRISLRGPWLPAKEYKALVPDVVRFLTHRLPDGVSVESTGLIVLFAEAVEATSRAFVESYGAALILISALMVAFLGSLRAGLLSMIPNVLPIAFTLGGMGWLSLDLDLFTLLIGSIALGLAVDDTIHLADAFRRFHRESGDLESAIRKGLETTGAAILTSSIALCLGFSGFMFSSMTNLAHFGALTVVCIGLAFAIDVLVLPALSSSIFGATREERSGLEDSLDHRKPSEGILQ
jgi:predicted RND superfamily exporter protein